MVRSAPTLVYLSALLVALTHGSAPAQRIIDGEITDAGGDPIKLAVPLARATDPAIDVALEIVDTLRADLDFSGFFHVVRPSLYNLVAQTEPGHVRHEDWLEIGAEAVTQLSADLRDERIEVEAQLYDNESGSLLFHKRYGGRESLLRRIAHQLADDLVELYTGRKGVATTRIAFVSDYESGKEVYLMDYDGRRIRRLTTSRTINLSPVWSPQGNELAYVSWRSKQPGVYVMSSEGKLGFLSTIGGELSSAPDWSPDGRKLVYSSDFHGNTELYVLDRSNGRNTRLTRNPAIDTAPAFSPTGREIAFTSDRTGSPQIYIMDAEGLNVRRVSWSGSYNESAAWSPDGDRLAHVSRIDGRFSIVLLDLSTEKVTQLTDGKGNDENPRWSADGRHLVFASDRSGGYAIYSMRANGSRMRRLTRNGNSYTPDWSR